MMPKVSIVTVVLNDAAGVEQTLKSIADQSHRDFELIIVDGASTDGTLDVLTVRRGEIDVLVSEADRGIYDAMNKAIDRATGEWLIFMNAGDRFASKSSLRDAAMAADDGTDVVYSDVIFHRGAYRETISCSVRTRRIHHQAMLYRRSIHDDAGQYLVANGVTISDYIFMNSIVGLRWKKVQNPIAICDASGVSTRSEAYYQKLSVDLIFKRRSAVLTGVMLIIYPCYRLLVRPFVRLVNRFVKTIP